LRVVGDVAVRPAGVAVDYGELERCGGGHVCCEDAANTRDIGLVLAAELVLAERRYRSVTEVVAEAYGGAGIYAVAVDILMERVTSCRSAVGEMGNNMPPGVAQEPPADFDDIILKADAVDGVVGISGRFGAGR